MKRLIAILLIAAEIVFGLPPAFAQVPACWPEIRIPAKVYVQPLPKGFRDNKVAVWTCATKTGFTNVTFTYKDSELNEWIPTILSGKFDRARADASCREKCDLIFEDNLVAAVRKIAEPYKAKAFVAPSGDATSRPVYALNEDGTRNTTAVPLTRVAVGAPCFINGRVGSSGSWYRVDGQPNVFTPDPNDKVGRVVAQCAFNAPLGVNN